MKTWHEPMKLPQVTIISYLLLLVWSITMVQGQTPVLEVRGQGFAGLNAMNDYVAWAVDSTGEMPPEVVQNLTFEPFSGSFFLSKNKYYWFRYTIRNTGPDSLKAVLCMDEYMTADLFFQNETAVWEHRKAGRWTNLSERSYPENRFSHFIGLPEGMERTYLIQISDYIHSGLALPKFQLLTIEQEKARRLGLETQKRGKLLFEHSFFGILVMLTLFSLSQFSTHRDKAYLFYAGYTASLFLFYGRSLDLDYPNPLYAELMGYHLNFEAPLGYLCYVFYIAFIRIFLNLPKYLPRVDRFMHWGMIAFLVLLVVDVLVLQVYGGYKTSLMVHGYAKLPFFLLAFWVAIPSFFQLRSRLATYVQVGTTLLLVTAIFTVITQMIPGRYDGLSSSIVRSFTPAGSGITWYMYDMRMGLLLEMACFLLGLNYKTRLDKLQLKTLSEENEKLKSTQPVDVQPQPVEHPFIILVRGIVESNLSKEEFGTPQLADQMNMGRVQLYRKMMTVKHVSPSEYIRNLRLEAAREKLQTSGKTVSEIAYEVGYKDPAHFARAYRNKYNVTPKIDQNGVKNAPDVTNVPENVTKWQGFG